MKHISILTLAALLTAGAALSACSGSDDSTADEQLQQLKPATGKYNMTVKAGEGAWRLPSEQDWQYMLWGYYAEDPVPTTISSFQNQLSAAGTGLATNGYYWTSTAVSDSEAKVVLFDGTYAGLQSTGKTQNWHVRACFAF